MQDVGVEEHPIGEREDLSNQGSQLDPLEEEACELGSGDILEAGVESSVLAELQEEQGAEVVAEELGKDDFDRQWLAKETLIDNSLDAHRKLADLNKEGYLWSEGLLYKSQTGDNNAEDKRLYLPSVARSRCLTLAHDQFGQRGYKRVAQDICRLFY